MVLEESEKKRRALRAFIARRKLTLNGWATKAGISEGTLRAFLDTDNPTHSLTMRTLAKLAQAEGVTVAELIGEDVPAKELPLWGYVGAGEVVHPFDGDDPPPLETVDTPPGLKNGAALIVRGDSMLPRLQEGDVVFFEMRETPPERLLNEECVVRLAASKSGPGPLMVKRLTRGTRKNRFHLVSVNPAVPVMEDQPVAWAAAIQWIRKRQPKR
jgi:hypothetical protein